MPVIVRNSCHADANLPKIIGGHRIKVIRHTSGLLAGLTTVDADSRATRILLTDRSWSYAADAVVAELNRQPVDASTLGRWAVSITSYPVSDLCVALSGFVAAVYTQDHVDALLDAERKGKNRKSAISAIVAFGRIVAEAAA